MNVLKLSGESRRASDFGQRWPVMGSVGWQGDTFQWHLPRLQEETTIFISSNYNNVSVLWDFIHRFSCFMLTKALTSQLIFIVKKIVSTIKFYLLFTFLPSISLHKLLS